MVYLKKVSFDGKHWYKLEWENVDFREFDPITKDCNSLEELKDIVKNEFPNCNLKINGELV